MANGSRSRDLMYDLLPAVYRERDAALGEPLRAVLAIMTDQANLLDENIQQLWNDFFIETCATWVIPYIGDLVGTTPLFDASRVKQPDTAGGLFPDLTGPRLIPQIALSERADVAKTIYYRRRKGTVPMLEELARDVTGWGAHVVEFFQLLGWTQYVRNHLRPQSLRTPDIRSVERMDRLNGPFDEISHTADVRAIAQLEGWYNIKNIGFFLWRLRSNRITGVRACRVGAAGDYRYHVSPLGNPASLFTHWRPQGDDAGLSTELSVPGPIRPAAFFEDLRQYFALSLPRPGFTGYYGLFEAVSGSTLPPYPNSSLSIFRDGVPVPPDNVRCMDLSTWRQPTGQVVGVDVRLGRLAFGTAFVPTQGDDAVHVDYHYGFSADLGGGPYPRRAWLVRRQLAQVVIPVDVTGATPGSVISLSAALTQWATAGKPDTIISIVDNLTYHETGTLQIEPANGRWLAIEAADETRPHLQLDTPLEIVGTHEDASVTLSGLLIEGAVHVTGSLGILRLLHCTLVPGRGLTNDGLPASTDPSVMVDPGAADQPLNAQLRLEMAFTITGPLRLPEHMNRLAALDSIVDGMGTEAIAAPGDASGPPSWLERVTIFGRTLVKELPMASEVIFTDIVTAEQKQAGCVRFSFVADGSTTPRRYRCQPDLEIAREIEAAEQATGSVLSDADRQALAAEVRLWLVPSFSSTEYGQPAYAQLHLRCPRQIQTGAEDESEIGAFCHLKQPQREANLRVRLEEYLPFGLEPGIIYVT